MSKTLEICTKEIFQWYFKTSTEYLRGLRIRYENLIGLIHIINDKMPIQFELCL